MTALAEVVEGVRAGEPTAPEVLLRALTSLRHLRDELAVWEPELITAARSEGVSWAVLAPALGVTSRQAAERRYLRLQPTSSGETTGEARVQATRDQRAGDRAVHRWARGNAAALRQLAGQVSATSGLDADAQQHVGEVHDALAADDAAGLLGPLTAVRPHLTADHPSLAEQITDLLRDAEHHRTAAVAQRQGTPPPPTPASPAPLPPADPATRRPQ
jgi:hypothetical protein